MKSLYNVTDNHELLARLNNITPATQPQWGKMNAAQMLAHCQVPLQIGFGELQLKRMFLGYIFGSMAKKKLMSNAPFDKNLPTFNQALIKHQPDFEVEKEKLSAYIKRLATGGPEGITKRPHPFFGPLSTHEWDQLQYKHLNHHLEQFGV
ncbi:DUF1569 domain-containing protein [Mucilaginibacter pedocola]|uniref:DUF1569 domain-containing protein n=1 Tax=Mucilaginibacter pedocola TaxID=1792845 RepID=A0A1S9PFD7_9SPHI|nr:DUF1569 domain-containing protein [Mucilaginibacter pedocola]OOQ59308.1 hypothetical protein BC343_28735 [Mucilaginibacter pedocola]